MRDRRVPCIRAVRGRLPEAAPAVRSAVDALAGEIVSAEPAIGRIDPFGELVFKGCGSEPKVLFGDNCEIPLLFEASHNRLDYRLGFLAEEGDLVVIGGERRAGFERYQADVLGLSRLRYMATALSSRGRYRSAPAACLRDADIYARLLDFVRENRGTTLFAYLTSGTIWALAAQLARDTGCRIGVAGPPPLLSRRANDKLWFGKVAARLFGEDAVPAKRSAHGRAALVRHVGELARKWDRLVIKVPDSAGSAGNCVVDCAAVRELDPLAVDRHLRGLLPARMLGAPFPVAVEVWDTNVLTSPSVQVWIPDPGEGEPVIEGIFEQILIGAEGEFAGATIAELPQGQDARLAEQALALSLLFQSLGYFGRCSFDAVLFGSDLENASLHWVECNARWGGVSIPMSFANRYAPDRSFTVVQYGDMAVAPRSFEDARAIVGASDGDVVLLSPDIFEAGSGCHFVAFGETAEASRRRARRALRSLQAPPGAQSAV